MRFSPGCSCCGLSDCTDCCDPAPPSDLYVTFTATGGSLGEEYCGCLRDGVSVLLPYGGSGSCQWGFQLGDGTTMVCENPEGGDYTLFRIGLTCNNDGTWVLEMEANFGTGGGTVFLGITSTASVFLCDPLEITFESFANDGGTFAIPSWCGSGITATVTA